MYVCVVKPVIRDMKGEGVGGLLVVKNSSGVGVGVGVGVGSAVAVVQWW